MSNRDTNIIITPIIKREIDATSRVVNSLFAREISFIYTVKSYIVIKGDKIWREAWRIKLGHERIYINH